MDSGIRRGDPSRGKGDRSATPASPSTTGADKGGLKLPYTLNTAYLNSISAGDEPTLDGDFEMEKRVASIVGWNAMAMVVRGNQRLEGIGGQISSYTSAATLFDVGFNHFFRGEDHAEGQD